VQTAWIDDDGRVEALDPRFVREPGGRQSQHGAAEFWVMADGEARKRVGRGLGPDWERCFWFGLEDETVGCWMGHLALMGLVSF